MSATSFKAGDVLGGKYRVERVLGAGGMGMVVAARHIELGQRVALKFMLKEAMADPANAERFAREARAAVRLQSAHTARVIDVGKLKTGEPYMVMEYLDGNDLDEVLQRSGPMAPHVAVAYMIQACEAFAEAHGLGMVHRDIKLKNLFLTKRVDGRPLVKVLDFGLAKTIGALGDVALTATSAVFGSPQYMSPEQMRAAKDVDARSDIWSIGVCLYELLTGRVPFDGATLAEICAMVLKDPVEAPSKWVPGLPPDLSAIVVKCLAKDPRERFQTVADLAFALEPWSEGEGSARRILDVMHAVQGGPTLMNLGPRGADADQDGAKTLAAWDSGGRALVAKRRLAPLIWAALGVCGILGLVGFASIVYVALNKRPAAAALTAPAEPTVSAPALGAQPEDDAAVAVPVPVPVASPETTLVQGPELAPPAVPDAPPVDEPTSATRRPPAPPALPRLRGGPTRPATKSNPADHF